MKTLPLPFFNFFQTTRTHTHTHARMHACMHTHTPDTQRKITLERVSFSMKISDTPPFEKSNPLFYYPLPFYGKNTSFKNVEKFNHPLFLRGIPTMGINLLNFVKPSILDVWQSSEFSSGFKYAKILNMPGSWIWQGSDCTICLNMSEFTVIDRVLKMSHPKHNLRSLYKLW